MKKILLLLDVLGVSATRQGAEPADVSDIRPAETVPATATERNDEGLREDLNGFVNGVSRTNTRMLTEDQAAWDNVADSARDTARAACIMMLIGSMML